MQGQRQHGYQKHNSIDQQSFYRKRYIVRVTLFKEDLCRLIWLFQQYCQEPVILIDGIQVQSPQDLDRFHYPLASSFHATGYLFDSTHPATSTEPGAYMELRVTQTWAEIIVPSTLKREAKQAQTSALIDMRSKLANFINWIHRKFSKPSPTYTASMLVMVLSSNLGYAVATIIMNGLLIPPIAKYLLILPMQSILIGAFIWMWSNYVKDANNTPILLSLNDSWTQHIISKEQKRDIIGTVLLWVIFISLAINARMVLEHHTQWFSFFQAWSSITINAIFSLLLVIGLILSGWGVLRRKNQRYQEHPQMKKTAYLLATGLLTSAYALFGFILYNTLHP